MYVREAKLRCPDLEIVPYNFEAYEKVVTDFLFIFGSTLQNVPVLCSDSFSLFRLL